MKRSPRIAAAAAAVAALACAAPAAHADSLAYVKHGDIWLSAPDGSRQLQVTTDGGYSDVSQADDGTMIGLHGLRLRKLDRRGHVLADFDTPVSDTRPAPAKTFYGPYQPAISPVGSKVAYTYYYMTQSQAPGCLPPMCVTTINEGGTGYSWSDRQTSWDDPALGRHSGWRNPVWIDEDTTMLSDPTHLPNDDVILDTLSDGDSGNLVHGWFSDTVDGNPHTGGGDITRDRAKLAFQTGENDATLTVASVPSFPTAFRDGEADPSSRPVICYRYSGPVGGKFGVPTFAPDGARMAFAESDGIHVASVPSFGGGCTLQGATDHPPLVIADGSEPDWGPADVPAGRAAKSLAITARRGLKLTVAVPAAGRLSATAKRGRTVLAKARAKRVRAGSRSLTLKRVRPLRHGRVSIRVRFKPRHGGAQTVKVRATV
jgi:hypothetical protein